MSAAAVDAAAAPAPKAGKKKLIIILAAVLALAGAGGGAAVFMMKKNAAEAAAEAEDSEDGASTKSARKADTSGKSAPPVFMPLDVFTVNLADREADRYAQIGITLELDDAKTAEQIKVYMPAIRNNILMVIAHRTAESLLAKEGKLKLAREVQRESLRPLGVELEDDEEAEAAKAEDKPASSKKKKRRKAEPVYPIKAVHFSNFIIQ